MYATQNNNKVVHECYWLTENITISFMWDNTIWYTVAQYNIKHFDFPYEKGWNIMIYPECYENLYSAV